MSSNALALVLFALDVPFAVATGGVARYRGRRWCPWALFGLVLGPIAFISVLVLGRGADSEVEQLRRRVAALEERETVQRPEPIAELPVFPRRTSCGLAARRLRSGRNDRPGSCGLRQVMEMLRVPRRVVPSRVT